MKRWSEIAISFFLVPFLFIVVVAPNRTGVLSAWFAPITPFMEAFDLAPDWKFFAPDAAALPTRLEWEILSESEEVIGDGIFPEDGFPYAFVDRQTRRFSAARFFFSSDERFLGIWPARLCRAAAGAHSVRLWKAVGSLPSLPGVLSGETPLSSAKAFNDRIAVGRVFCRELESAGEVR